MQNRLPKPQTVSTHSRAKAAASVLKAESRLLYVSTHSRAKAAAIKLSWHYQVLKPFQHTVARRRLRICCVMCALKPKFQHTVARRRLLKYFHDSIVLYVVSTHSRAKAAAKPLLQHHLLSCSFNTQSREGGCC